MAGLPGDVRVLKNTGEGSYLRQQFPKLYGVLGGLLGTSPDEMRGSVMDPLTAQVREGADMGYWTGLLASNLPPAKGVAGLGALAGMFVGKGSKTWDALQASKAMQLEKSGADAHKVWSETGTWKGPAMQILERNGVPVKQPFNYPQGNALATAQRNAALPVDKGGLGLGAGNTPMERAKAMGFDTEAYHGKQGELYRPQELGQKGLALRKEAQEIEDVLRTKYGKDASGYKTELWSADPLYAKRNQLYEDADKIMGENWFRDADITGSAFDVTRSGDIGVHLASKPMTANKFAENGAVMPLMFKADNIHRVDDIFSRYQGLTQALGDLHSVGVVPSKEYSRLLPSAKKLDSKNFIDERDWGGQKGVINFWNRLNKITAKNKTDALVYDNAVEAGGDSFSVLNPKNIRSRFAAFDPMRRNEADILGRADPELLKIFAGAGLLGVGGYSALQDK